jgi:hypothetical protein
VSPPNRLAAAVLAALFLTTGPLPAQAAWPAPQVNKLTIYNGTNKTVTYSVQGGSPRLRARFRKLQFAENEVTLVEQLQQLKMAYVANELALEGLRAGGPVVKGPFFGRESSIKIALADTLAQEATPEAAIRLIDLLEQAETEVETELRKLPPDQRDKLLRYLPGMDGLRAAPRAAAAGDMERRTPSSNVTVVPKPPPRPAPAATDPTPAFLRAGNSPPLNRPASFDPPWLPFFWVRAAFEQTRAALENQR